MTDFKSVLLRSEYLLQTEYVINRMCIINTQLYYYYFFVNLNLAEARRNITSAFGEGYCTVS